MAFGLALGASVAALIAVPHLLPLQRVRPTSAVTVWLLALCLRALVATAAAVYMLLYLPGTPLFARVADWCWQAILPGASVHIPGLPFADALSLTPALVLGASLIWAACTLVRARLLTRRLVRGLAIGDGPLGSTVLASDGILVAVTRTGPARLLVSGAALAAFDREELAAGLQHELGHLHHAHRPILLASSLLRAVARWLPGTNAAHRELAFNLERDADEYALSQTRDPLALASAICKAAAGQATAAPLMGLRGQSRLSLRLDYLMDGGRQRGSRQLERTVRALATVMLALTIFLAISAPSWALTRPDSLPPLPGSAAWHC